jgi:hypothetical protein
MKPEKRVTDAVEKAQGLLADYVQPGRRDCSETIGKLMDVLDDGSLIEAVDAVKHRRARKEPARPSDAKVQVLDESGAVEKMNRRP